MANVKVQACVANCGSPGRRREGSQLPRGQQEEKWCKPVGVQSSVAGHDVVKLSLVVFGADFDFRK